MAKNKLTPKQELFIKEYLVDLSPKNAAIRAGYSKNSADVIGVENLAKPSVALEIQKTMDKRSKRIEITADRVLEETARLAYSQMGSFAKWGSGGVKLKDSDKLTPEDMACISEVSETVTKDGGSIKFKLHDKGKMIELLGKHLSLFRDTVNVAGDITIKVALPDEND